MLNGCDTVAIGRAVISTLPSVAVVCWESVAEDSAARAFAVGFYGMIAEALQKRRLEAKARETCVRSSLQSVGSWISRLFPLNFANAEPSVGSTSAPDPDGPLDLQSTLDAFDAGCRSFLSAGFRFGDPLPYLHPPGHPHERRPDMMDCPGCTPPVHGSVVLMYQLGGECIQRRGTDVFSQLNRKSSLAEFSFSLKATKQFAQRIMPNRDSRRGSKSLATPEMHDVVRLARSKCSRSHDHIGIDSVGSET